MMLLNAIQSFSSNALLGCRTDVLRQGRFIGHPPFLSLSKTCQIRKTKDKVHSPTLRPRVSPIPLEELIQWVLTAATHLS